LRALPSLASTGADWQGDNKPRQASSKGVTAAPHQPATSADRAFTSWLVAAGDGMRERWISSTVRARRADGLWPNSVFGNLSKFYSLNYYLKSLLHKNYFLYVFTLQQKTIFKNISCVHSRKLFSLSIRSCWRIFFSSNSLFLTTRKYIESLLELL
jgi:hypothetical protein